MQRSSQKQCKETTGWDKEEAPNFRTIRHLADAEDKNTLWSESYEVNSKASQTAHISTYNASTQTKQISTVDQETQTEQEETEVDRIYQAASIRGRYRHDAGRGRSPRMVWGGRNVPSARMRLRYEEPPTTVRQASRNYTVHNVPTEVNQNSDQNQHDNQLLTVEGFAEWISNPF